MLKWDSSAAVLPWVMSTSLGVIQRLVGGGSSEQSCFKNSVESHWYWRNLSLLFSFFKNNFIYLFRPSGPSLLPGLFSSCCDGGCSLVEELGLSGMRALVVEACGFTGCYSQLQRGMAQQFWCTDLVALQHVGSSQIRDQTCVSCNGRWILYHWATREALGLLFFLFLLLFLFFLFPRLTLRKVVSLVL